MTDHDTIARADEARKLAGFLRGFARVFRDFPDAELWGRPEEAEHTARIMEQTRETLLALAETATTPAAKSPEHVQAIDYATRWLANVDLHKQIATPFPKETMRLLLAALREGR